MSDYFNHLNLGISTKHLSEIDEDIGDDGKYLGESVCAQCKFCLIFEEEYYYCTAGEVKRIPQHPITGLEARIFIPYDKDQEYSLYYDSELPFPICEEFNHLGNCNMFELGKPNTLEYIENQTPPKENISYELDAYLKALKYQNKDNSD